MRFKQQGGGGRGGEPSRSRDGGRREDGRVRSHAVSPFLAVIHRPRPEDRFEGVDTRLREVVALQGVTKWKNIAEGRRGRSSSGERLRQLWR